MNERTVRVASVQATPVFFDLQETLEKACTLMVEAGRNGAGLVALPEGFVPSFPVWVASWSSRAQSGREEDLELYAEMPANAVDVPGPAFSALGEPARTVNRSPRPMMVRSIFETPERQD